MSVIRCLLVCTDLDRTLLPNGEAPESPGVRERFAALAARPEVVLAYVTGRHRTLVEAAIDTYSLPRPRFVAADVGTTIYEIEGERWRILESWETQLGGRWGVAARAAAPALLASEPGLSLQEAERQARFKLSFYAPLLVNADSFLGALHERLVGAGQNLELVYSVDEDAGVGLLDLLPRGVGKRAAIEHLLEQPEFSLERTLFAGDSGNDLDVLASPIPAVLVANASPEVRSQAQEGARARGNEDRLLIARGGEFGTNGNYSSGILEGIVHYWPEIKTWIR